MFSQAQVASKLNIKLLSFSQLFLEFTSLTSFVIFYKETWWGVQRNHKTLWILKIYYKSWVDKLNIIKLVKLMKKKTAENSTVLDLETHLS